MVPPSTLEAAMQEIRGRYPSEEEFLGDLASNGLDEASFAVALEREMKVEAILEKVATQAAKISDMDVELYYQYHPEQFRRPETRLARHILITINETIAENTRSAAAASASQPSPHGWRKNRSASKSRHSNIPNVPPHWMAASWATCRAANFFRNWTKPYSN